MGGEAEFSARLILPLCLVVGVLVRIAVILGILVDPVSDAAWYFTRASELAQGLGYQERGYPTAYWPVGYPAFLSGLFGLFGPSVLAAQVANVVLWAGTLVLLHDVVHRLTGRLAAANLVALVYSIHLNAVGYSALLLTEPLYTFLLMLCGWAAVALRGWRATVVCGVLLGLLTLIKAQTWPFGMLWAGAILLFGKTESVVKRVGCAGLLAALMFVVVLPWSMRNLQVFGSFVLVSTNGGISLAVANHPNSDGSDAWASNPFRQQIGQSVADQVGADLRAKEITWRWIRENPVSFLNLAPRKFFWAVLPDGESEWGFQAGYKDYERHRTAFRSVRWVNQLIYLGMLGTSLVMVFWLLLGRHLWCVTWRPYLLFSAAYVGMFLAVTFVFNGQSRYHYPLVPLMCAWIGMGWSQWRGGSEPDRTTRAA